VEAGVAGTWDLATNDADTFQACVVTAAFSSRLGDWLLGARYRGEFRFPFGTASTVADTANNTASVSLQWDPNR